MKKLDHYLSTMVSRLSQYGPQKSVELLQELLHILPITSLFNSNTVGSFIYSSGVPAYIKAYIALTQHKDFTGSSLPTT